MEKIVQLGYNATSAHVICIFLSFHFFLFLFLRLLMWLGDNMTLKLLSEWDETFYALLLKSFMIGAAMYNLCDWGAKTRTRADVGIHRLFKPHLGGFWWLKRFPSPLCRSLFLFVLAEYLDFSQELFYLNWTVPRGCMIVPLDTSYNPSWSALGSVGYPGSFTVDPRPRGA